MRFCRLTQLLCKSKISNFANILMLLGYFFEENVLALEITMNDVFLMNSLKTLQNLYEDVQSLTIFEHLFWHSILIGIQVTVFTVLHDQKNGLRLYMGHSLHMKVLSSLTMLGCRSEYIELISWDRYFSREGFLLSCFLVMHLIARGKNYWDIELPRQTLPNPPLPNFFMYSILFFSKMNFN